MSDRGSVYLVGGGPGDPELVTVKALRILRGADVVVHDRLVARELIEQLPARARRIDVGKSPGDSRWPQSRINALLVAEARRGRNVVRLKGGDPFVFGRGGEECQALAAAGIRFEIVPGISSAIAAPAFAGIPVTHRGTASAFTVVTGHAAGTHPDALDWELLSRAQTLVVLMGLSQLPAITRELLARGRAPRTPVAVIGQAGSKSQIVVRGRLEDIAGKTKTMRPPATIVIGEVVKLADELEWFDPSRVVGSREELARLAQPTASSGRVA